MQQRELDGDEGKLDELGESGLVAARIKAALIDLLVFFDYGMKLSIILASFVKRELAFRLTAYDRFFF